MGIKKRMIGVKDLSDSIALKKIIVLLSEKLEEVTECPKVHIIGGKKND